MALSEEIKGISVRIGADTTQLSSALKDINSEIKGTGQSLKEIDRLLKFDPKNTELLAQKQRALKEAIEESTKKTDALKQAQKQAKDLLAQGKIDQGAYDQLTREIISAEQQTKKYKDELKETKEATKQHKEETDKAAKSTGSFGDALKTAGIAAAAAATAIGAAAISLGKDVVNAFAEQEQLIGGVETLFGTSARSVEEYAQMTGKSLEEAKDEYFKLSDAMFNVFSNADEAYKTTGLSANEYMETVTSFSASLISAMGGDTKAAADKADRAIRDMSDNANKMGTDMQSIQNAYQGFAKGQYTLLDNLKLGYGGTKTEMQRLLKEAQAISNVKYDINSYADIIDAIGVIQDKMGITGTTAAEAEGTISGSLTMLSKSYQNLIADIGNSDQDIEQSVRNVTDSFKLVVENITPVIENLASNLPMAFQALFDVLIGMLPMLLQTASSLFSQILSSITESLPELTTVAFDVIMTVVNAIIANLPLLIQSGIQIVGSLLQGIGENIPSLIDSILNVLQTIVDTIINGLPTFIENGAEILNGIIDGIFDKLPELITTATTLIITLATAIMENLPTILQKGMEILQNVIDGILAALPVIAPAISTVFISLVTAIIENLPQILEQGVQIIAVLIVGLIQAIPDLIAALPEIFVAIVKTFKEFDWASIGLNLVQGIVNGIKNAVGMVVNAAKELANKVKEKLEDAFDINSPSRWASEVIGKNLDLGLAIGIDKYKNLAVNTAKSVSGAVADAFSSSLNYDYGVNKTSTISVTTPVYLDGKVIATVVNNRLGAIL